MGNAMDTKFTASLHTHHMYHIDTRDQSVPLGVGWLEIGQVYKYYR
jgi:hypothetical protein